eukprot:14144081-Ditylum_brightwellii.AAC.1
MAECNASNDFSTGQKTVIDKVCHIFNELSTQGVTCYYYCQNCLGGSSSNQYQRINSMFTPINVKISQIFTNRTYLLIGRGRNKKVSGKTED